MPKRKRRRNIRFSQRLKRTLYKCIAGIDRFFTNCVRVFRRLNPTGRALALGGLTVVLAGVVLLCTLPGKNKNEPTAAVQPESRVLSLPGGNPADEDLGAVTLSLEPTPTPVATPEPTPEPTIDPTLQRGMEGEEISKLQARLMELGYMSDDIPTELFGPVTEASVQRFQRQYDIQQDGIAGPETLDLIYSSDAKHYALLEGFSGTDVDSFQRQLKELGYLSKVTGYYGTETIDAVKSFQKQNRLSEDGKAGEKTFNIINSDKAKPHPNVAKQKRRNANIDTMISVAKKQLGDKYVLGAEGPKTFDCSGLVYYCLKEAGSNRRRLNAAGYSSVSDWEKITTLSTKKLKKGDLLFFYNNAMSKVGHVGIYIGNGEMVDASSSNGKVVRRSCLTSHWKSHFVCARRPW